jgi:hypothetical protein
MGCETPFSLVDKYQHYTETCYLISAALFHPAYGSNRFLCNDRTYPSHYVASHLTTLIQLLPYITVENGDNMIVQSV